MKTLLFATLLCAICVALPGRAAVSQPAAATAPQTLASTAPAAASSHDGWNASPVTPLTRAQVYRELVHAERDGQLARLDRELYSH